MKITYNQRVLIIGFNNNKIVQNNQPALITIIPKKGKLIKEATYALYISRDSSSSM